MTRTPRQIPPQFSMTFDLKPMAEEILAGKTTRFYEIVDKVIKDMEDYQDKKK